MSSLLRCAAAAALLLAAYPAASQTEKYPSKPVRLIVPFSPGGGTDITARALGQKLSDAFGQSVVIDNRPGASGMIGAEITVKAAPDGHTMIMVSTTYAGSAALYKLPYDPVAGVTPVVQVAESAFLVTVHPSLPVRTIAELIAHARANPGKINYGSTGTGGITHLATESFSLAAGTPFTHVPYKGTGAALADLLGNQIQMIFGSLPSMVPQVKAGRLRGLAVTTPARIKALPEMPTVAEAGVPGFESVIWYGILGPRGLAGNVVGLWNREVNRIIRLPEMQERYEKEGLDAAGGTPAQFRDVLRRDIAKLSDVVKRANIKPAQ